MISDIEYVESAGMAARKKKASHGGKRPGSGRPPTLNDPVRYILSLERAEIDALETIAAEVDA